MGAHGGPADWWTEGTDAGRTHIATRGIVQDGLVLNLDAGVNSSYPGSGTIWSDLSGNSYNGTLINGTGFTSVSGGGLSFDGVNDHTTTTINKSVFTVQNEITLSIWFNLRSTLLNPGICAFQNSLNSTNPWILLRLTGNGLAQWYIDGGYYPAQVPVTQNSWINLTLTYKENQWKSYVNSELDDVVSRGIGAYPGSALYIGNGYNGYADMLASQVIAYTRALTDQEIRQNFNATRGRYGI